MTTPTRLTHRLLFPILAAASLAACGKQEVPAAPAAPAAADAAPAKPAFVSKVPHASTVDVATGGIETQQALSLSDTPTVAGQLTTTAPGSIVGVSVMVGNYGDTATGPLDVEVCVADSCSTGTVDAGTSIDNEMLELSLATPVQAKAGDVVTYKFTRAAGANPIALWTYSAPTATDHLATPADVARTPRLSLLLN